MRLLLVSAATLDGFCLRAAAADVRYNAQIQPILAEHCVRCHGRDQDARQGDFRIDRREDAVADRGDCIAVVPGRPDESEVLRRILSDDAEQQMPPPGQGDRLTTEEVALLRQWIAEGAVYERHWAYEPIVQPDVPSVDAPSKESLSQLTDIDAFLVAQLAEQGLELSPPADKRTLIRRATFDLTGLPPTWQEVQEFVNDSSPDAYAHRIDRLLASPRYGERWGRHWLDIARYADTHGAGALGAKSYPFAYTYRDYVIAAFNSDVPYDRFILEQIAADQLGLEKDADALAALGFLTVGRRSPNPHDILDDRIDVVTRGLMGLTVVCARCHDHKFDEIATTDYYALYAVMDSSGEPEDLPLVGSPSDTEAYHDYLTELERRKEKRDDVVREQCEVMRGRLRMEVGNYLKELVKGAPEQDPAKLFLSYRTDDVRPMVLERWRHYLAERTSVDDPVFGPWRQLAAVDGDEFAQRCTSLLHDLREANGDAVAQTSYHTLAAEPPRWNPRVLDALSEAAPESMLDVADAYGRLFADVHQQWLHALLDASREALPGATATPDEDLVHLDVNSSVNRQLRRHLYDAESPTAVSDELAWELLNRPVHDYVGGLRGAIHELHLNAPGSPARAMVLAEAPAPSPHYVFRRGNPLDRGDAVEPRFLSTLPGIAEGPFENGKRRLGLAQAIVDPSNPLTRRVAVNWVWQRHFGRGLVATPDDFGVRGEPPTHPELLDYLASVFLEDGWSIKRLHRRMMMSAAYQQASFGGGSERFATSETLEGTGASSARSRGVSVDPQNRLLWRMPVRRLEMEAMRDAMLAAAGKLDGTAGGRPYDLFAEPFVPRRSVYGFVNRDVIHDMFSTFDMADPNACTAERPVTVVAQQALYALNSHFIQEQAQSLAALATGANDRARLADLFRRAYAREPSPQEEAELLSYIASSQIASSHVASSHVASSVGDGSEAWWGRIAQVLLAANEFVFID